MEDAAAVRRAALTAVDDVEPTRLRERIHARMEDASLAPGVLTLASARAVDGTPVADAGDGITERAAGVQLIYEGLNCTRTLTRDEAWAGDREGPNLDILLADILVARGFYLLARTEAAGAAVGVVRAFGRDQTLRRERDDPAYDHTLESDVLELAVVAGTTAVGGAAPDRLRTYATNLANGELPSVDRLIADDVADELATRASGASAQDGVTTSVD